MPPSDTAASAEGESTPVPVSVPERLDFPVPPACEAGFALNVQLLEHHWSVLRKASGQVSAAGRVA